MVKHPFKEGTKLAKNFMILSDGKWHCGKHELPGTQPAKAIQIIRQHGFQIENKPNIVLFVKRKRCIDVLYLWNQLNHLMCVYSCPLDCANESLSIIKI